MEMDPTGAEGAPRRGRKIFKCRTCDHISETKEAQWTHARAHIPEDRQLSCDRCPFVTEFAHHLEYHQRNHAGNKPFECTMCAYACVEEGMLRRHMRSHGEYPFRCGDCNYATKYAHSLKIHSHTYGHRRNSEGPNEALPTLSALSIA